MAIATGPVGLVSTGLLFRVPRVILYSPLTPYCKSSAHMTNGRHPSKQHIYNTAREVVNNTGIISRIVT